MATVADLAGISPLDVKLSSYNRTVAAAPNGVTTPLFVGEMLLDTSTNSIWRAMSAANTSWVPTGVVA